MRIGVFTLVAGEAYYRAVLPGLRTKRDYCRRHGYDFLEVVDHSLLQAAELPVSWYKLRFLADILLAGAHDVLFCSDADVCITNPAVEIEAILQAHLPPGRDLLFSRQSVWAPYINAGNFFVRRTPWAQAFLREWFHHGREYESQRRKFWEQAYINDVVDVQADRGVTDRVQVVCDQRLFNAFHLNWQAGDFLIHFPTLGGERLEQAMVHGACFARAHAALQEIQEGPWFPSAAREESGNS